MRTGPETLPQPRLLGRGIATGAGQPQPTAGTAQLVHQPPPPLGSISRGQYGEPLALPPGPPEPGNARFVGGPEGTLDRTRVEPARPLPPAEPSGTPAAPAALPAPMVHGAPSAVVTPRGDLQVHYAVVEARDLVPSHHPGTFGANPNYPAGVRERDYASSQEAQARVVQQAQNFDPRLVVNGNPDAVNGPPVVTPGGVVLGGNSRPMSVQRLYGAGHGEAYKNAVTQAVAQFGLDAGAVAAMRHPVLVRVADAMPAGGMAALASDLNRNLTGALSDSELAASRGRQISPETLQHVGGWAAALGPNATLADVLQAHGKDMVGALVRWRHHGPGAAGAAIAGERSADRARKRLRDQGAGGHGAPRP